MTAGPAQRDRYVDLLRASSICAVVLGHWMIGSVGSVDGELAFTTLLDSEPRSHLITWVFQVMPVFFLVGGYANAASLSRLRPGGTAAWIRRRTLRLLRPAAILIATVIGVRLVTAAVGGDTELAHTATWGAVMPLWFLVVYLGVVLVAPWTYAAHRRWGRGVVVALVVVVAVGDVLRIASGVVAPAVQNYALGWLAVHQAGFVWYDGGLPASRRGAAVLAASGLGAALLLVGPGPYGMAMVGAAAGSDLTNTAPPTVALLALATAQTGIVLLLRRPATAWVARPRVWALVVRTNIVILTLFLWHMAALVVGGLLLVGTGLWPDLEVGSAAWWAWRPAWIGALAVILAVLVALLGRFEHGWALRRPSPGARAPATRPPDPSPALVGLGVSSVLVGMAAIGVTDTVGIGPRLAGIPVVEVSLMAVGLVVLERTGR